MLDREEITPRSDLASLGYVLVELLAGRPLFAGIREYGNLLEAKRTLPQRLSKILPKEVTRSELLMTMYLYLLLWFFAYCYPIALATTALERRFQVR